MIKEAYSNMVLTVENAHVASCGRPPGIRHGPSDGTYVGYFANRFGEQWVLVVDRESKTGVLRGGDIGWETEISVANGQAGDLVLGKEERQWLDACWRAACG